MFLNSRWKDHLPALLSHQLFCCCLYQAKALLSEEDGRIEQVAEKMLPFKIGGSVELPEPFAGKS